MKEKNIRELARRMGLITVENMCQYTIAQLVVMVANKVNELVDEVWRFETDVQELLKSQNENIQYLLGEGLHLEVENIFDGWIQDGTFDTLLNHSALKKVNDRIDETNTQLSVMDSKKLDKDGIVTMLNMGQDVKEAMTGGSVAVVGKDTVLEDNIVDKQVTPRKTNFFNSKFDESIFRASDSNYAGHDTAVSIPQEVKYSGNKIIIKTTGMTGIFYKFNTVIGETYTFVVDGKCTNARLYPDSKTSSEYIEIPLTDNYSVTFVATTDIYYFRMWFNGIATHTINYAICYSGNKKDLYSIKEKHIQSVPKSALNILKPSKNLVDKSTAQIGKGMDYNYGTVYSNATHTLFDYIKVEPNTQYWCNKEIAISYYDNSFTFITGQGTAGGRVYTTPSNCYYIRFSMKSVDQNQIDSIQFELGTYETEYVSFNKLELNKEEVSISQVLIDSLKDNALLSSITSMVSSFDLKFSQIINEQFTIIPPYASIGSMDVELINGAEVSNYFGDYNMVRLRWNSNVVPYGAKFFTPGKVKYEFAKKGHKAGDVFTMSFITNVDNCSNFAYFGAYLKGGLRDNSVFKPFADDWYVCTQSYVLTQEDIDNNLSFNEFNFLTSKEQDIDLKILAPIAFVSNHKIDYFRVLSVLKSSKNANGNAQPLPYNGKKLCTLGDSITASGAWQPYVISNLGFSDFVNCGIGGTKVSGDYGSCFSHDNRINSIPEDSDVIIIMGGTNDCGQSVELGDLSYPFNVNTFKGGLAETIRKTQARCPNAIVVVSSLLSGRGLVDGDGNAINMTEPVINNIGLTSEDYAKATQEVAHFMSVDFIDLFGSTGINQFNRKLYISDTVHATVEGNKKIAKVMINGLKNIHPIVY